MPQWLMLSLVPAIKALDPWEQDFDIRLATGGGTELPGVVPLLNRRNIAIVNDGVWANVRGLYGLAHLKLQREG